MVGAGHRCAPWLAVAMLGCGRIDFEPTGDAATSDTVSNAVTYVGPFVARGSSASASDDMFTAQAQQAGDAIVFQLECNFVGAVPSVSFDAPGWTLVQLSPSVVTAGNKHAVVFGAIAPDTNLATFIVQWPVACSAYDELADELANVDPTGGTTTFRGLVGGASVGDCTATVVTSGTNDAVWGACSAGGTLTGVGAGYTKGADDLHDDWTAFRLTDDPPGTSEVITFTDSLATAANIVTALTIASPQ